MGSTLRIKFAICLTLFLLSGCSLFDDSVENCEEPQEYQDSLSMPPLIVPEYLRDTQNRSIFNIPNTQGINASNQQSFSLQKTPNKSMPMTKESNQINNIESEELSELLQLIDQTISNRQLDRQFQPIYESATIGSLSDSSLDPCLDGPPQYFSEKISPRSMPTQTYIQPSKVSETGEEGRCGQALDSIVCPGTILSGGRAQQSILGANTKINSFAEVHDSILFDGVDIGRHSKIRRAIIDKGVRIPPETVIGYDQQHDRSRGFTVTESGITVIAKGEGIEHFADAALADY